MYLVGYHGTSRTKADQIMKNGFTFSNENNWLGNGVYFWGDLDGYINGYELACWWVRCVKKISEGAVIKASISTDRLFDCVGNYNHRKMFHKVLERICRKKGCNADQNCLSMAFLKLAENYDVLRFFTNGNKLSGVKEIDRIIMDLQIQICVKDEKTIVNKERNDIY